jgi:hypothetical protein
MPSTVAGVGTKCWGQRERGPDGSFVTTVWFVVFDLPIFPLRSMRVLPGPETTGHVSGGTYRRTELRTTPVPFSWKQVINVYASFIAIIAGMVGSIYVIGHYL